MIRVLGLLALILLAPALARAQCTTSTTPVSFGVYVPTAGAPDHSTGNVTVKCSGFTGAFMIALSAGGGGSFANRRLSNGSAALSYQLYNNAGRTVVWGDGSAGTGVVSGGCYIVCNTTFTIYGLIPALQVVSPGTYFDTIVATVTF